MLTSRKALVAVVGLLVVTSLLPIRYAKWVGVLPTMLARNLSVPVSDPVSWASHKIRPTSSGPVEDLTAEQWALQKQDYDRLNRELWAINKDLRETLAALEAITININPKDVRPVEAGVVNFNNDRNNPVMLINQGTRVGIAGDDPVVFRTNLLGFVEREPGLLNCNIQLVSRPGFNLAVILQPLGAPPGEGVVEDRARAHASGQYFYVDRSLGHGVEPGHIVWSNDDRYPNAKGFLLGRVTEIAKHPDRPLDTERIIIRPDVPIGLQGRVMVITQRED
ncbi:MAG: rod shape-determining protein MreC [Planctomycetota bacterium]